jgi:hypothetical protein
MHHGDELDFIDVSTIDVNNRFAEFISSQGVDFVYDVDARLLRIRVCYSRILAQSSCVRETLIFDNNNAIPAHHRDENPIVIPGTFFMRDGALLEVISVNENDVIVHESDSLKEYAIGLNEAAQLIDDYSN